MAVILASSLGLGWCASLVISAAIPEPVSEGGLNLLGSLGQTLAGAVAAYLGYQLGTSAQGPGAHRVNDNSGTTQDEPTPTDEATPPTERKP